MAPAVCDQRQSCGDEDFVYPATIGYHFRGSQSLGGNNGWCQIAEYPNIWSDSNIVLPTYSQSTWVVGDIVGSGGGQICDAGKRSLEPSQSPRKEL